MHVVGVVHGKGGVGKSTIAINLARSLQLRGLDVCIIDTDQQGTSQNWKASGDADLLPAVFEVSKPNSLEPNLRDVKKAFDVAVIDGGAHLQRMHAAIIRSSDLVLVPVQPSPADVWPTRTIVEMVETRQDVTGGRPAAAFVVSRRKPGTNLGKGIQDILSQHNFPVWEGTCDRVAYAEAMGSGTSVIESTDEKAANEIDMLTNNVINTLNNHE